MIPLIVESGEESGFQVEPGIDGVRRETSEPIKGYPLEGANEQSGYDSIIVYNVTSLRPKVVDVLIRRSLAIIRVQHWWFELWRIWDQISFQGVRTDCPYFLQFIPLGQGCDLSLDAFDHFGID